MRGFRILLFIFFHSRPLVPPTFPFSFQDLPPPDSDDDADGLEDSMILEEEDEEGSSEEETAPLATPRASLRFHTDSVYAVNARYDTSSAEYVIATGGGDDKAAIYRLPAKTPTPTEGETVPEFRLEGHSDSVVSVSFSHDGALLATAGLDAKVNIWDTKTGAKPVNRRFFSDAS